MNIPTCQVVELECYVHWILLCLVSETIWSSCLCLMGYCALKGIVWLVVTSGTLCIFLILRYSTLDLCQFSWWSLCKMVPQRGGGGGVGKSIFNSIGRKNYRIGMPFGYIVPSVFANIWICFRRLSSKLRGQSNFDNFEN